MADIPEEERQYTLEELTLSPAERERVEVRGLLMAAIHDGLAGAITGQVSDRGVERCADHILREWVPRFLAGRSGPVRDIPEEMVEKAVAEAVAEWQSHREHVACGQYGVGKHPTLEQTISRALSAALAGRTVLELPEPDMRHARALVQYWNRNPETLPQEERFALQKLADVREARRLAAGSGVGDQT